MKGKRKAFLWLSIAVGIFVVLCVGMVLLAPTIIVSVKYPALTFDLSRFLNEKTSPLFTNKTATISFGVKRGQLGSYDIRARGVLLDWPFHAQANIRPKFRWTGVDIDGEADLWLTDTPWSLRTDFNASSTGEWQANLEVPATEVNEQDTVLGSVISRWPMPAISNLVFGGTFSLNANGSRTKAVPVPKWTADCRLKDFKVSCAVSGLPVAIENLRMGIGASGIANHIDMKPMFPHADSITLKGCLLSNAFASIRATESAYLVTEAGANCCGGELKLYSFFLDPKKLNVGVTMFVDGLDTGDVLRQIKGFNGEASGKLYGKIPIYLKNGKEIRLKSAYLHSVPGETGNLKVFDPKPVLDNLALGGVPDATRDNVAKALTDLNYSVLKLSLSPEDDGGMALAVKLAGSATRNDVTVPVSFEVTFHGDVEQLINTGLKAKTKLRK